MVTGERPIVRALSRITHRWQSTLGPEQTQTSPSKRQSTRRQRPPIERDFLLSILAASSTKREAKDYIRKFDVNSQANSRPPRSPDSSRQDPYQSDTQLEGYLNPVSIDQRPEFSQFNGQTIKTRPDGLYIALLLVRQPESISEETLVGVGKTLGQLSRLGLACLVVLDDQTGELSTVPKHGAHDLDATARADQIVRWVDAINDVDDARAQCISAVINKGSEQSTRVLSGQLNLAVENEAALVSSLRRGVITFVSLKIFDVASQRFAQASADELVYCLTRHFAGLPINRASKQLLDEEGAITADWDWASSQQSHLDRLIVLDTSGGLPTSDRSAMRHIFVNLEQEYARILRDFRRNEERQDGINTKRHQQNLTLLRRCLGLLPPSSSAVITRPEEAAQLTEEGRSTLRTNEVGTRTRKNPLIHSLLTDKPMLSSSLPPHRMTRTSSGEQGAQTTPTTTFLKTGMPVTILPNAIEGSWRYPTDARALLDINDSRIDVARLITLIEDSFNRPLDAEHYFARIKGKLAGLIIAGEYEGGALLTWELPPEVPDDGSLESTKRMVPYLDKFAVLKRSQGSGGVADVLFKTMVTDCFPEGVCWRSRRNNPVNKWYFERARGTWKIPESNWTMFWTTPDLTTASPSFIDYEAVCRSVQPSWADTKAAD